MWNKFKSFPLSVQLSIGFLLCLLTVAIIAFPPVGIVLGTAGAIFRVFFYLTEGK
jgi:hypothetical protein